MKRVVWWLVIAVGAALAILLVWCVGSEWSEAIVQGFAALGALWYWAYRSRPRVNLRLLFSGGLYLELTNTGNRVAKQVRIKCDPPIPWSNTGITSDGGNTRQYLFGPIENFGDMAPDQRYVCNFGNASEQTVEVLDTTRFEISHESTWGVRRRRSNMRFGGSGERRSMSEVTATPFDEISQAVKAQHKELIEIRKSIDSLTRHYRRRRPTTSPSSWFAWWKDFE